MYEDDFLTHLTQDHSMGDHSAAQESTALQTLTKENHALREQYATLLHEIRMRDEEIRRLAQMSVLTVPMPVMADSYKAGHFQMYPDALVMSAYGEFRSPMEGFTDQRIVFCGLDHIIKTYLERQWTELDVANAKEFYKTHNTGFSPYEFPEDLFLKFIREQDGYFPVRIDALPEGSVAHIRTPVFTITATREYSRLCTFLETVLTMVWYPTTVATLSRHVKELIRKYFVSSVDVEWYWLLDYKLHDFGFRACTCVEQAVIGGKAHLLNFKGSDTMPACYDAQFNHNAGHPVASSVPATEHSVMTSWPNETDAMLNMLEKYGENPIISVVMDSYDYDHALNVVLPDIARVMETTDKYKQCQLVLRPDSGDPVESVLKGLLAAEKCFGVTINKKGYKVLNRSAVLQGDGITMHTIRDILTAVTSPAYQYSAQNVVFGMGGGLLQKVNRDTMSFATKLSYIQYNQEDYKDVMKMPKTDSGKYSLPGLLAVAKEGGNLTVYPADHVPQGAVNAMQVVYDNRPLIRIKKSWDEQRQQVEEGWHMADPHHKPLSEVLKAKASSIIHNTTV